MKRSKRDATELGVWTHTFAPKRSGKQRERSGKQRERNGKPREATGQAGTTGAGGRCHTLAFNRARGARGKQREAAGT